MNRGLRKSTERYEQSTRYLAGGSSTLSKRTSFAGDEPPMITRGKGCRVWDLDGNEYIDHRLALGPVSLGHAIDEINAAMIEQLRDGLVFGHPHPLEGEVAQKLCELIPCAEKVRFLKTGGEAVSACIKIARAATGRDRIIHCGYNGWLNRLSATTGGGPVAIQSSTGSRDGLPGIPDSLSELHSSLPWGDLALWETALRAGDVAAVVVASEYEEMEAGREFLPSLRELTRSHGTLMIMDEIVTGFRVAIGGVHEYFGFLPDLAVFAKGLANGMPLSVYAGRADLLDSSIDLRISSTFGGEVLSLAATKAVLDFYTQHRVIDHMWRVGDILFRGIAELFRTHAFPARIAGFPVCSAISFDEPAARESFFRACYRNGVCLYDTVYVSFAHKESDISESLMRIGAAVTEIAG